MVKGSQAGPTELRYELCILNKLGFMVSHGLRMVSCEYTTVSLTSHHE